MNETGWAEQEEEGEGGAGEVEQWLSFWIEGVLLPLVAALGILGQLLVQPSGFYNNIFCPQKRFKVLQTENYLTKPS